MGFSVNMIIVSCLCVFFHIVVYGQRCRPPLHHRNFWKLLHWLIFKMIILALRECVASSRFVIIFVSSLSSFYILGLIFILSFIIHVFSVFFDQNMYIYSVKTMCLICFRLRNNYYFFIVIHGRWGISKISALPILATFLFCMLLLSIT